MNLNKQATALSMLLFIVLLSAKAQEKLRVIRSNVDTIAIRENGIMGKNRWTIMPKINPDILKTSFKNQEITFITDVDSISWLAEPGKSFNFVILKGKDSAHTRIEYEPSKLDILKLAGKYNNDDNRSFPKFTYQSMNDSNLVVLRKSLHLDSIAGSGPDISKVLNLLHWIHNLIPHDGNHDNPVVRNALSMIRECKKTDRRLNCRGLAIILNECYLSLGYKSRYITCMPKDSVFNDCHVINIVYINELNKWVWIDPTNNAYVMNELGELLSPQEVRERLVNGKSLILNPDANWNNKTRIDKEFYLNYYMAKNLYRIQSPLSSEFDYETSKENKELTYVELLPLDAYKQTPQYNKRYIKSTKGYFTEYKTNNQNLFWVKP